jgi:glycosyltransferase involved in cell wall biosynthesis
MNHKVSGEIGGDTTKEGVHRNLGVAALIPVLNPAENLIALVYELCRLGFAPLILVDDGSDDSSSQVFDIVSRVPDVKVLRHPASVGRGNALKTGFNHFLLNYPDCAGVVTMDAGGLHSPEDALTVAEMLLHNPTKLVLGRRVLRKCDPWAVKLANIVKGSFLRLFVGKRISDTQMRMWGISRAAIPQMIALDSERYEFEMGMLINSRKFVDDIVEQPIKGN